MKKLAESYNLPFYSRILPDELRVEVSLQAVARDWRRKESVDIINKYQSIDIVNKLQEQSITNINNTTNSSDKKKHPDHSKNKTNNINSPLVTTTDNSKDNITDILNNCNNNSNDQQLDINTMNSNIDNDVVINDNLQIISKRKRKLANQLGIVLNSKNEFG